MLAAVNVPDPQALHTVLLWLVPLLATYVPGPHPLQGVQAFSLAWLLNWPAGQEEHCRLVELVPGVETYSPAAQLAQLTQALLFPRLYVPLGQVWHTVLLSGVPATYTNLPAGQTLQGAHLAALSVVVYPGTQ